MFKALKISRQLHQLLQSQCPNFQNTPNSKYKDPKHSKALQISNKSQEKPLLRILLLQAQLAIMWPAGHWYDIIRYGGTLTLRPLSLNKEVKQHRVIEKRPNFENEKAPQRQHTKIRQNSSKSPAHREASEWLFSVFTWADLGEQS